VAEDKTFNRTLKEVVMDHEKLDCYNVLLKTAEEVARRVSKWPRGYAYLSDQLNRAMTSAVLNLAEGNGKRRYTNERKRFFEISTASIAEVGACLDLASVFGLISSQNQSSLKSWLKLASVKIKALP
jgi:four helix bundle protein